MRGGNQQEIPEALLLQLSQSFETAVGLHFPREKWRQLADGIAATASALGFQDAESCVRHLLSTPLTQAQVEILAPHLTVGETYFFREPAYFAAFEADVLPRLIRSRRGGDQSLRIWSAGCATGEEPYSLAILLERLIPDIADWRITILGTDINPAYLQRAAAGSYGEWSFRSAPRWLKARYFRQTAGGRFEIHPHIRGMVTFAYLNLAADSYPLALTSGNAFDVIFCRNVLMYFAPHGARKVMQRLYRVLADGGWLALSATEASNDLCSPFSAVAFPDATLYHKNRSSGPRFGHTNRAPHPPMRAPGAESPHHAGATTEAPSQPSVSHLEPIPAPPGVGADASWAAATPAPPDVATPIVSPPTGTERASEPAGPPTPEVPDAPYKAALALYEAGRYAEVVALLADSLPGQPEPSDSARLNGKAAALMARAFANQGQLAEALRCSEIGVALDKLNPGSHYLLATVLQEQGREAEAVLSLRRALYLDQDFVAAHFALGNLARQRGRLPEATRHFRNAAVLLERCAPEAILPESEGMTAGSLKAIIRSLLEMEAS